MKKTTIAILLLVSTTGYAHDQNFLYNLEYRVETVEKNLEASVEGIIQGVRTRDDSLQAQIDKLEARIEALLAKQ